MDKKEKSCGVVVVKDNKVLLVKSNKGHYGFPKGHMENNETEEETAIRETKEETNIDVTVEKTYRYEIYYNVSPDVNKTVIYFIGYPKNDEIIPQDKEIAKVLWVDIDEVNNYLQFANIIELWNDKIIKDIKNK